MNIRTFLEDPKSILILDGGLATELQTLGCDLNDPLWSGKVLIENPSAIVEVQNNFLKSGSRCIITASYQTTPETLSKSRNISAAEAFDIIKRSVTLAKQSRELFYRGLEQRPHVFIAGSVGSYGALLADGSEYRGDYHRTDEEFKKFHFDRIEALVQAGVDLLAIETQPSAAEVRALVDLLERDFPKVDAWVSFTVDPKEPTKLCDGTPFADIVPRLDASPNIIAIGVNCIPLQTAHASLQHLSTLTKKPLVVYTNSGEEYSPESKEWSGKHSDGCLAKECELWLGDGARLIGGCCRTTPKDISELTDKILSIGYKCSL